MPTLSGWVTGLGVRGASYRSRTYIWNGRNRLQKYDGVGFYNAGIERTAASASAPAVALGTTGVLSGTYYYFLAPVNSRHTNRFGYPVMGAPSAISAAISPAAQKVTVTLPGTHSDSQVDKWYIFRNRAGAYDGDLASETQAWFKVGEAAVSATSFSDNVSDDTLDSGGIQQIRFNLNIPPTFRAAVPYGERLFGWGFETIATGTATVNGGDATLIDFAGVTIPDGVIGCWFRTASGEDYDIVSRPSTTQIKLGRSYVGALSGATFRIFRNPWEIYVSEFGDWEAWGPLGEGYGGRWTLELPGRREPIAGCVLNDTLFIFTWDQIWGIQGKGLNIEAVRMSPAPLFDGLGCVSRDAVAVVNNRVYFLSARGPAMLAAGQEPVLIGEKLGRTWLDDLAPDQLAQAACGSDGRYVWFSVPETGQTENGRTYRYDIETQSWWEERYTHPYVYVYERNTSGIPKCIYAQGRFLVEPMDSSAVDLAISGTVRGTVTTGGTLSLTDSTASFLTTGQGLEEAYVHVFRAGAYVGSRRIASNTGTALTWSATGAGGGSLTVAVGDTYEVGAIRWWWKTKDFMLPPGENKPARLTLTLDGVDTNVTLTKTDYLDDAARSNTHAIPGNPITRSYEVESRCTVYAAKVECCRANATLGLKAMTLEVRMKQEAKT